MVDIKIDDIFERSQLFNKFNNKKKNEKSIASDSNKYENKRLIASKRQTTKTGRPVGRPKMMRSTEENSMRSDYNKSTANSSEDYDLIPHTKIDVKKLMNENTETLQQSSSPTGGRKLTANVDIANTNKNLQAAQKNSDGFSFKQDDNLSEKSAKKSQMDDDIKRGMYTILSVTIVLIFNFFNL